MTSTSNSTQQRPSDLEIMNVRHRDYTNLSPIPHYEEDRIVEYRVTFVLNSKMFYGFPESDVNTHNYIKMIDKLAEESVGAKRPSNPKIGQVYGVELDQETYRCEVVDKSESAVKVCFVDYGDFKVVLQSELFEISTSLQRFPVVCRSFGLDHGEVDDPVLTKWLCDTILNQVVTIVPLGNFTGNGFANKDRLMLVYDENATLINNEIRKVLQNAAEADSKDSLQETETIASLLGTYTTN